MKGTTLVVVCSASGLPQNTEVAHQAVWAKTAQFLRSNLGELYSSFYPVASAWGIELHSNYGVLLGREDPEQFIRVLLAATEAQSASIGFHIGGLLSRMDLDKTCQVGDAIVCPVTLDGTDKELEAHSLWHIAMASGIFLPDCCIYYLDQKRAVADRELKQKITRSIESCAVCAVRLEVAA